MAGEPSGGAFGSRAVTRSSKTWASNAPAVTARSSEASGVSITSKPVRISGHTLGGMPEEKRPDIRPQLREFLAWYEEVLGRIASGRSWRQENRSASPKKRQPWLTFSISLIPARTSMTAETPGRQRRESCVRHNLVGSQANQVPFELPPRGAWRTGIGARIPAWLRVIEDRSKFQEASARKRKRSGTFAAGLPGPDPLSRRPPQRRSPRLGAFKRERLAPTRGKPQEFGTESVLRSRARATRRLGPQPSVGGTWRPLGLSVNVP